MTPEQWRRVQEVFARALELEAGQRADFLAATCGPDEELREELDSLLAVYAQTEGFSIGAASPELAALAGEAEALAAEMADDAQVLTGVGGLGTPGAGMAAARMRVGTVLDGKYRVEGVLGAGGMGTVYRATHLQLQRPVALKVIRADLLANPATAERFRREALAAARLRHPNIVTVHDYGEAEGAGAYLVMELLEGNSLRAELAGRGRLGAREALELMAPVCEAVGAAHRAGVIHRDLKPDNIFLEQRGGRRGSPATAVKVLDFGIAKLREASLLGGVALTMGGAVIGTPAYMSPEQCRGETADARSDVYALGCVLYEMLTGKPPFASSNAVVVLSEHVSTPPRRPSELVAEIEPWLEEALVRALAKAPGERHQTVEAFARALGFAGHAAAPATAPPGVVTVTGRATTSPPEAARVDTGPTPNNLPRAVTRFIGREEQIAEVLEQLARSPLVTLVGSGGIGKSRLALEVARVALEAHPDGVWLVELASLSDPTLVPRTVAGAVGVPEGSGRETVDSLREWLQEKRVLLLLDNCEHLVDGCARLAEQLVRACARLCVLATSREALGVAGEVVWRVPTLSVPEAAMDADEVLACEAVRMFTDRAALSKGGFTVTGSAMPAVAALCRRLEGIPLAIELAAARAKVLSVEQILVRLEDRFRLLAGGSRTALPRQQTLRATLDWSYDLLAEEERALLRRLGVFAGGWTLEAAEAAGKDEGASHRRMKDEIKTDSEIHPSSFILHPSDVLDVLTRLVDKSLVLVHERGREARYGMLETIREYGLGYLEASGEAEEARARHADYYVRLAEQAEPETTGARAAEWFERLAAEHDNVRAALEWLLEHDPHAGLRLAAAAAIFWHVRGHLSEGRRWLEAALERSPVGSHVPGRVRANALRRLGRLALEQGELESARPYFEESVRTARELGDTWQIVLASLLLGHVVLVQGDLRAAREYFEEALASSREVGNGVLIAESLNLLGEAARHEGAWAEARRLYEQAEALWRQEADQPGLSTTLVNLGAVIYEQGDLEVASACFREALASAQALAHTLVISISLDGAGAVATKRGGWARAARLAGAAEALRETIGQGLELTDRAFRERYLAEARERLGETAFSAALAAGRALAPEQAVRMAVEDSEE